MSVSLQLFHLIINLNLIGTNILQSNQIHQFYSLIIEVYARHVGGGR